MISGIIKVEVSVKRREGPPSLRFSFVRGRVRLRLATSRPLGERSEPCLAAKRPTASDEVARGLETCLGAATRRLTNLWVALLSKINCRLLANGKKDNEYNV